MNIRMTTVVISAIAGGLIGGGTVLAVQHFTKPSSDDLIKEFYDIENAAYVSPHSLRQKMSRGETDSFVLVDLRSPQEYEKEHVVTAVNIPAYKDPNTSAYEETERIIGQFRALPNNKELIVYCYSMPCMTGRKIGKMLADNNIFVKHLGIGWNEWRYFWNLWNHDGETPTSVSDFIVSGKEPGTIKSTELPSPCGEGDFGC